jgi:hypothetical protein
MIKARECILIYGRIIIVLKISCKNIKRIKKNNSKIRKITDSIVSNICRKLG